MMGGMMAMGLDDEDLEDMGMPGKKKAKKNDKKRKDSSDGEWETVEQNGVEVKDEKDQTTQKKVDEDDGWETESD